MNQQTCKQQIGDDIEAIAEQLIMADLSDASVLKALGEAFERVGGILADFYPLCGRASRDVGNSLGEIAESGQSPDEADLQAAEKVILALQTLASRDVDETELALPGSSDITGQCENNGNEDGFAVGVDQEILEEYLAHQESVIVEIEELILAYEEEPDPRIFKELRRFLHTAKGEAGVVGLNAVERMCHQVEDYIQDEAVVLQIDPLLEFKDWFEQTIAAIKAGEPVPSGETLLEALTPPKGMDCQPECETSVEAVAGNEPVTHHEEKSDLGEASMEPDPLLNPILIEDPEITADFVSETIEHFEVSDENLLTLESEPENEEAIASIFRAFHTVKGTSSFLGLTPISSLAHVAENILDEIRKKRLDFEGAAVDAIFNAFDLLKTMVRELETALGAGEMFKPDPGLPEVMQQLKDVLAGEGGGASAVERSTPPRTVPSPRAVIASAVDAREDAEREPSSGTTGTARNGRAVKQTMKIDADRIDLLLETIGELVIMESIVSQEATKRNGEASRELERNLSQLTKITRSLQDMGMSMRLIPIDNTFRKMGRLVRDLSKKSGKKIELIMEGKETELDKGMVEKLGDPLVHMIRNSVDHGIERTTEERIAAGKPAVGKIVLKAYHQGGGIHIVIQDDGRGLDRAAILAKAMERGIVVSADGMSDEDVYALIFEPGFSTAAQITDVSGRGVGMDVVKSNIESMRGNVRIASEKGKGTVFTLVLPLTMAIIDGMIVRVGKERYILPLLSIIESFKPTEKMISTISGKGETVPFRNRMLPLFRLYSLFGVTDAETDPVKALVVVIEDAGRQVALLVDELLGQNQTVIKTLGEGLGQVDGVAGASIMTDGTPGLIIDVNGLVKMATA